MGLIIMVQLIVGLGNPGNKYKGTRHNIGFIVVNELAQVNRVSLKKKGIRFKAYLGTGNLRSEKIILAMPLTYMNASGKAIAKICNYYRLNPEAVLVVHDDMDLPFGRIKITRKGGDGGHKGVGSVIAELGTNNFLRIRVGIGRPPSELEVTDYVLTQFTPEEEEKLPDLLNATKEAIEEIMFSGYERAMNQFNKKDLLN